MILYKNAILVAFIVINVAPDSIFALIAPVGAMEELMVVTTVAHTEVITISILFTIPIQLPTQIQTQIQNQILLETLNQHRFGSTFM